MEQRIKLAKGMAGAIEKAFANKLPQPYTLEMNTQTAMVLRDILKDYVNIMEKSKCS